MIQAGVYPSGRAASAEAAKRSRVARRNGSRVRYRPVKSRRWSLEKWDYVPCWTVVRYMAPKC